MLGFDINSSILKNLVLNSVASPNTDANVQNVGWNLRRLYIVNHPDPKGSFSFKIPLKHIFRFCGDYDKVVYGFKHALILTRSDDHDAIFRAGATDAGKIMFSKVSWFMPDVLPADKDKMDLYKIIQRKEKIPVGYRMIQCTNAQIPQTNSFSWRLSVKSSPEVPGFIIFAFKLIELVNKIEILLYLTIVTLEISMSC